MFSLTVVAVFSVVAMLLAWNWQKRHANAGVVDVVWAFGMMFAGPWYALTGTAPLFLKVEFRRTDLLLVLAFGPSFAAARIQGSRRWPLSCHA